MTPLEEWVEEQARLTQPDRVHWCDGSEEEAHWLIEVGLYRERVNGQPVFFELNHRTWPHAYLHRSHPNDVARTEHLTFVCHPHRETAGPNNNWMEPREAKQRLLPLFEGCMKGRTMYVIPHLMGHPESPYAKACVQVTDSAYVAVSMRIMTRMGREALERIGSREDFMRGLHSIGDLDPERRFIMHFPEESLVWSVGSGYGGNALLGKKCFSLRLASWQGFQEGWLAEHMIIIGVEEPNGEITYLAAAFPSACGKTNLAMLESPLPGYKVWTLGDDIAWLNVGPDGRLWAINPEMGFFGVAPGTSTKTNPNMIRTLKAGTFFPTLFTNVALNSATNEPWWEELSETPPSSLVDWQGRPWNPTSGSKAAHPNARFTVSITQCPTLSSEFQNPRGVPISAILFGSRRPTTIPLVYESFHWQHGVFCSASMASETTAASAGRVGQLRRDPMAMLPFCGYNMADYFRHWLRMGARSSKMPRIFHVNWFRTDASGRFLWPGFGENLRVLKWIIERVNGGGEAEETPIGYVPTPDALDLDGLALSKETLRELLRVDPHDWHREAEAIAEFFHQFGDRLPEELWHEHRRLLRRLG